MGVRDTLHCWGLTLLILPGVLGDPWGVCKCNDQTYVCHNIEKDQISDEFKNRAECLGDKQNHCRLKIKEIRNQDSGNYYFRFEGDGTTDKWFGEGGVELNVTELMVTSSRTTEPIKEGDNVTLTCATKSSCNVSQSELTWLKDKTLFPGPHTRLEFIFISHQNSGTYSCALKNNITISSNEIIVDLQPKRSVQFLIALLVGIVLTMLAVALVANIYFKR
ncbi:hypothetical protein SKAU_G00417440 [Synaphobranchus kaupii]|uniref:Ig-like domain-containing protein n=1 Tax=Synaphobranchus kaupii TaxID=118154 RepID=A0A9Q1I8X4_SYNKA|nr:hypothetical protein SKAU_G00417440 [Synaphobranchus kaupii]